MQSDEGLTPQYKAMLAQRKLEELRADLFQRTAHLPQKVKASVPDSRPSPPTKQPEREVERVTSKPPRQKRTVTRFQPSVQQPEVTPAPTTNTNNWPPAESEQVVCKDLSDENLMALADLQYPNPDPQSLAVNDSWIHVNQCQMCRERYRQITDELRAAITELIK